MSYGPQKSYFYQRIIDELGATEFDYKDYFDSNANDDIIINFYSLDGKQLAYPTGKYERQWHNYQLIRLNPKRVTGDNKYIRPKKWHGYISAFPWFHHTTIEKYKRKVQIDSLYITEGVFKAFKGILSGLDVIGLQGIHNYAITTTTESGKDIKQLDPEIKAIIEACQVKNIVFLCDGDCLDIHIEADRPDKDLFTRPNSFYSAIKTFRELTKEFNADTYFAHIQPEQPKGLDDLLIEKKEIQGAIIEAARSLQTSDYFYFSNVTSIGLTKIKEYFKITTPETFYAFHQERIGEQPFVFIRNKYKWNNDEERLDLIRAKEADMYIRVGDDYIKRVQRPNRHGKPTPTMTKVLKSTIKDDWIAKIPNIFTMIEKYEGFVVQPEHINYQPIVDGWINEYRPFLHTPEAGNCPVSIDFVKHIFGSAEVEHDNRKIPMYEIALDYIQLLYQRPREILPVVVLVSEANQTGKGTFKNWIRQIFGENSTEVTIDELDDSFNDGYATKLLIVLDEALVDRFATKERIKYLSTNETIKVNPKGLKRFEVDFYGKFWLLSNNEKNCIPIDKNDDRFWVHKVPEPKERNPNLLEDLIDEIPAFLYFLNNREMAFPKKITRAWFPRDILHTPAYYRMLEFNRSFIEKAIIEVVRDYFTAMLCCTQILEKENIPIRDITEIALERKVFTDYLKENNHRNWTPHQVTECLKEKFGLQPRPNGTFSYPVVKQEIDLDNVEVKKVEFRKSINIHYIFKREDFFTEEELKQYLSINASVKVEEPMPF